MVIAILLGASWASRPDLAAQALPIEATLVVQSSATRRASAPAVREPAVREPAPREPEPARPKAEPPPPVKEPARPQAANRVVSSAKPEPKAEVVPPQPKPAASKPKPQAAAPATPTTPAPAADPDKARREAELRARLAAEEHADALRASGAMASWTQGIRGKVERAWLRPPSVTAALDCVVRVTQVPGGEVVRVEIQACNGDASARESIEAAVYRASPLPQPPDAALFERIIEFRFHPTE